MKISSIFVAFLGNMNFTNTLYVQYSYTSESWIVPIALKMSYDEGLWDIKQKFLAKSSVWTMRGTTLLTKGITL